jgi:site-specific recombinase XerC
MTKGPARTAIIPAHIDAKKLPTGIWWDKSGAGKWMLKYKDADMGKWRSKRLIGAEASLAEIWQAYESHNAPRVATFSTLSKDFQQTPIWRRLAISTQRDYLDCHMQICSTKGKTGTLGDVPLSQWTIGLVRKYRDKRGEASASRANKELAYIKRIFSWAYEYEKIKFNPADGVKKLTIKPRQHYAEDSDYEFMLQVAKESNYWYVWPAMEIAYLCRMRLSEVLDLSDANELPAGLLIKRRKGSRDNITEWNPRLRAAWDHAIATRNQILADRKQPHPIRAEHRHIIISERTGDKIVLDSLKTAIGRITVAAKQAAEKRGINWVPFTFHDLKRKGVSDTSGDKLEASGHRTASMLNVYDVKLKTVKPSND